MTVFDQPEYQDQKFSRVQAASARVEKVDFHNCTFTDCTLSEAQFNGCRFYECTFKKCDLSLIQVKNCAFVSTRFEDCKVIGVNWTDAVWEGKAPRKIDFLNANISYSTFIHVKLPGVQINGCTAQDVDFAEADLTGADCRDTDFSESRFLHTNLTKVDFMGARNYSISPALNTIKQAKFALPEAISLLRQMEIVLIET
jgi:fluoroquinolone resistance protein